MGKVPLVIRSWNVNGLRACDRKGFRRWLDRSGAFLAGVQEVRARESDLPARLASPRRWQVAISSAEKRGYSGVGFYAASCPDEVVTRLGEDEFDREGRVQIIRFGALIIANVYFPNGSGPNRDHSRVPYKLAFYRRLFDVLAEMAGPCGRALVMGDFNTAHRDIDLARPRQNQKTSGFLPEERDELDRWMRAGWVDTFRHFEPRGGHYSWWSQRFGVREKNIGWRIDYVLATGAAMPYVRAATLHPRVAGSDHCPIGVELDPGILRR